MTTLFSNFLAGTTTDSPLSAGATTINSSAFANLPVVADVDTMWLVLDPDASAGAPEIVKVTAHTSSATSITVTRGQQSTTAREHASGTVWRAVVTKSDMDRVFRPTAIIGATSISFPTSTEVNITWATETINELDPGTIVSGTVITIPEDGIYQVAAEFELSADPTSITAWVVVNGAGSSLEVFDRGTNEFSSSSGALWLKTDDEIGVRLLHGKGSTITINSLNLFIQRVY